MSTTPEPADTVHAAATRLRVAWGRMPFGGITHLRHHAERDDPVAVINETITNVDALAAVLRDVALSNSQIESELLELRRQRDAVRAFLGTAS